MKHWWERRSGRWDGFHANPRWSYYMFLRAVYGLKAMEAWARVNTTKTRPPTQYECPDCEWRGSEHEMDAIHDVHERVATGEFMAPGDCPDCGALIRVADEDIPSYTIDSAIDIARDRGLLNRNFNEMTLALGLIADVSDTTLNQLTHNQLYNLVEDLRTAAHEALPPIQAKGMTLVRSADKRPVRFGDRIQGHRGMYVIQGGEPPRHSRSTGRVHTDQGVYFPSVVYCEWIAGL